MEGIHEVEFPRHEGWVGGVHFQFHARRHQRHIDFGNNACGMCSITALGNFDPDRGGHLILWDLKLVIRFPPGATKVCATVLIPSALIEHSNVSIQQGEIRHSFTQYTAGGLFRWVSNGFVTDKDFLAKASAATLAQREKETAGRWARGLSMFSIIDDL
ncbi:hypothetical protein FB45DRAFT_740792 [Roridomyces roridus]|uniref:Uncharacterized protein n=1 Tax=Roridomyces roridus TaxID=1738132 RepID=A0AAD7C5N0_9AGAR|nr:hypothetical protein FB45DRAFT_740792 [Roridomyces roridus]